MSFWKRTMDALGLGPDDAYYDEYDDYDDTYESTSRPRRNAGPDPRGAREDTGTEGVVRTLPSRPTFPSRDFDPSQSRRVADRSDDSGVQIRSSRSRVGGAPEPATVRPRRFDQAQEVADKFKDGQPVIMNLEGSEREIARRLIDFASGLCYGLGGSMEKVGNGVYLLKPVSERYDYEDA